MSFKTFSTALVAAACLTTAFAQSASADCGSGVVNDVGVRHTGTLYVRVDGTRLALCAVNRDMTQPNGNVTTAATCQSWFDTAMASRLSGRAVYIAFESGCTGPLEMGLK